MLRTLANLIAPDCCVVCNSQGSLLCLDCQQLHLKPRRAACFYCNHFCDGKTCKSCKPKTSLDGLHVAYYYEPPLDQLIYQLKYYGNRDVASLFARAIAEQIPDVKDILLTYIPVSGGRMRERGYNQAELLARGVANELNQPLCRTLLRIRSVEQIGQGRAQRYEAVINNFVALKSRVNGHNVVIVDDVVTSGATLNECARVLKQASAKAVWGLALAKK